MPSVVHGVSYKEIIKGLRFSPPPRMLSTALLVSFVLLGVYDLRIYFFQEIVDTPRIFFLLVPAFYVLTAVFLYFRNPLCIVTNWAVLITLHYYPFKDQFWLMVAVLCTVFTVYSMSAWFWLPTFAVFVFYYIFSGAYGVQSWNFQNLWGLTGAGTVMLFVSIPVLLRLQVEKANIERSNYEAQLDAAYRAANEERSELARELHDVVAHELTVIAMQSRMALKVPGEDYKNNILGVVGDQSRNALQELRRLLAVMRLEKSGELLEPDRGAMSIDLDTSLKEIRQQLENLGFTVKAEINGNLDQIPKGLLPTIKRITTETTTNIMKHALPESTIEVVGHCNENEMRYTVVNEISPRRSFPTSGFGLQGIEERIKPLGGNISNGRENGKWVLRLYLPF